MKLTVYCASSAQIDQKYFDAAEQLAHIFLEEKIGLVFGGGSEGLMGKMADVMCAGGGTVQGIMPKFMKDIEWAHPQVEDFIFTETMAERKELLMKNSDGIVTLAGGTGTLEELLEVITLKRLGQYTKAITILSTDNYYAPLENMFAKCVTEKFMSPKHINMWDFVYRPEEVLTSIANQPEWKEDALNYAALRQE